MYYSRVTQLCQRQPLRFALVRASEKIYTQSGRLNSGVRPIADTPRRFHTEVVTYRNYAVKETYDGPKPPESFKFKTPDGRIISAHRFSVGQDGAAVRQGLLDSEALVRTWLNFANKEGERGPEVSWQEIVDDFMTERAETDFWEQDGFLWSMFDDGDGDGDDGDDPKYLGEIGIWPGREKTLHIGYWRTSYEESKGVMTAATASLATIAFNNLDFEEVVLRINSSNLGSSGIAARLGAQIQGNEPYDHPTEALSPVSNIWVLKRSDFFERFPALAAQPVTAGHPLVPNL